MTNILNSGKSLTYKRFLAIDHTTESSENILRGLHMRRDTDKIYQVRSRKDRRRIITEQDQIGGTN